MKKVQLSILLACMALLISCTEPVMDASSYVAMKNSYKKILSSLPNEEKQLFSDAYNSIVVNYLNHAAFREKGETRKISQKRLERVIGGMNASQIIEVSNRALKASISWDIQDLEKRINKIKDYNKQLDLVTINQYKLYTEKDGGVDRMFLDIVIHNGSKYKLAIADLSIRVGSSYSDTLSPQKHLFVTFPKGLEKGQDILKKIDLGYLSSDNYFPKKPILKEYLITKVGGNNVSNASFRRTLPDLKKALKSKRSKYMRKYGKE